MHNIHAQVLFANNTCTRQSAFGRLCMLLLGAALGACTPWGLSSDAQETYGLYTVVFDKNGGDTDAVPRRKTIRPPATHIDSLPEAPSWAEHRFLGWNTKRDGSGTSFHADTPVEASVDAPVATIVYAQWRPILSLHLPRPPQFTPMTNSGYDGKHVNFSVTVSGLKNDVDAQQLKLQFSPSTTAWFSMNERSSTFAAGSKQFQLEARYSGSKFEESAEVLFRLTNIPEGYDYDGQTQTLLFSAADGSLGRPILLHQSNIQFFYGYANIDGLTKHYQLTENVMLSQSPTPNNWAPVGTSATRAFNGSFDGKGHSISGLRIAANNTFQGLFGYVGANAEIRNLGLKDVNIAGVNTAGNDSVGGVAGRNDGKVHNCYVTGKIDGRTNVGGIVGLNNNDVQNCYATSDVSGTSGVGGVVGRNDGNVQNCYSTGNVSSSFNAGGVLGTSEGEAPRLRNCVALNPNVSQQMGDAIGLGRVGGTYADIFSNNYARSDMRLTYLGSNFTFITSNPNGYDGGDVEPGTGPGQYNNPAFWSGHPLQWDFNTVWEWGPTQLPILRNLGGEQRP